MTRHNLGDKVVQELGKRLGWPLKEDRRFNAKVAKGVIENQTVHLLLPLTYMNLSGMAVKRYIDYYKIPLNRLVVIVAMIFLCIWPASIESHGKRRWA